MRASRVGLFALLCVVVAVTAVPGLGAATATATAPDCGDGADSGVAYTAESGLAVSENDPNVTFASVGDESVTLGAGAATVTADGNATLRVDDAAPLCLGNVSTSVPVIVDAAQSVTITGEYTTLAVGTPDYGTGTNADLSYDATDPGTVELPADNLTDGTTVYARAGNGSVLTAGTVESGSVHLTDLPAGSGAVTLQQAAALSVDASIEPGDTTVSVTVTETAGVAAENVSVAVLIETADGTTVANRTVTAGTITDVTTLTVGETTPLGVRTGTATEYTVVATATAPNAPTVSTTEAFTAEQTVGEDPSGDGADGSGDDQEENDPDDARGSDGGESRDDVDSSDGADDDTAETSDDAGPGLGVVTVVIALVAVVCATRRTQTNRE